MKILHLKGFTRSITLLFLILQAGGSVFPATGRAGVTLDGTMGPAGTLTGPDYQIMAASGTLNNTNLFHSFGKFNIGTGESATFSGPSAVQNIIARVTGGSLSDIDGLVRSDIMSANLYMLNPAGFLFGPNAQLDVTGSFHVSTSDYITLGETGVFYADPSHTSRLTVDPPAGFGFLGSNPGSIVIKGSRLEVLADKIISLVGGDIQIKGADADNQAEITAPGGRVDMASVSSPGEIVPYDDAGAPALTTVAIENFGNIDLKHAKVDAGGNGGGTVFIRGGRLAVDNGFIYAGNRGASASLPGNGIDIKLSGDLILDDSTGSGSYIDTNILNSVAGDSGGVRIQADHVEINHYSGIESIAMEGSNGQSGDISIDSNSLSFDNRGGIQAGTEGSQRSGDIIIKTGDLSIQGAGYIYTNASGGTGDAGNIYVTADKVLMANDSFPGNYSIINSYTSYPGTGQAGNVTFNVNELQMQPRTDISSTTYYLGQAGIVDINATGNINITGTRELDPNGWDIYTGIFANTFWQGDGGSVEISAESLDMSIEASIQTQALSVGDAGNILLNVGILDVSDLAYVTSTGLFGAGGDGGNIDIKADSIRLSGLETASDPYGVEFTGISSGSSPAGGIAGDIKLKTSDLTMTRRASIGSVSYSHSPGGDIIISADNARILNGSQINVGGYGTGDGGRVEVDANYLTVSGVHPEIFFQPYTGSPALGPSAIAAQAGLNGGNGGSIDLTVGTLEVLDGANLTTGTFGAGNGGSINIVSDKLVVSGVNDAMREFLNNNNANPLHAASQIIASANSYYIQNTGNGGNINIQTSGIVMENSGWISAFTETPGKGGDINISSQRADLASGARISTESRLSENAGDAGNIKVSTAGQFNMDAASLLTSSEKAAGGDINVQANSMNLSNNTLISAQSSGAGNAGSVYLSGQDSFIMRNSKVTTDAKKADGGNIKVHADRLVYLVDSEISASVGGGATTFGGNISIDPEFVILKNSRISANAFEGQGGNIDIVSNVFLADPDSSIDASSKLGIDGQVEIRSPVTYLSSLVSPLSKEFRSAVALLRTPCMARVQKGKYSSLMIKGRDSLPVEPGRFLSSPLSMK